MERPARRGTGPRPREGHVGAMQVRVGIAGLGTVGSAVLRRLRAHRDDLRARTGCDLVVTAASSRDAEKARRLGVGDLRWSADPVSLATAADVDLLVELVGGAEGVAKAAVEAALGAGKPVVTANKALLAHHGAALARLAEANGAALAFEGSVAGGIPIVKTLREGLAANRVARVQGILNGTCNYILTRMEDEGLGFEACLADAQRLGYAEADPSFDVDGFDTAHKLAILATLAFGTEPDPASFHVEGIRAVTPTDLKAADDLGYRIKLLGVAQRRGDAVDGRVHPTMVPKRSAIAQVGGVANAVTVFADAVGELTLVGPGAGGDATASAVVADVVDLARGVRVPTFGRPARDLAPPRPLPLGEHEGGYYMRLDVVDRPGAVAAIAAQMAERAISFESIMQHQPPRHRAVEGSTVPVVLITYDTRESAVRAALDAVVADGHIAPEPQVIRIERD